MRPCIPRNIVITEFAKFQVIRDILRRTVVAVCSLIQCACCRNAGKQDVACIIRAIIIKIDKMIADIIRRYMLRATGIRILNILSAIIFFRNRVEIEDEIISKRELRDIALARARIRNRIVLRMCAERVLQAGVIDRIVADIILLRQIPIRARDGILSRARRIEIRQEAIFLDDRIACAIIELPCTIDVGIRDRARAVIRLRDILERHFQATLFDFARARKRVRGQDFPLRLIIGIKRVAAGIDDLIVRRIGRIDADGIGHRLICGRTRIRIVIARPRVLVDSRRIIGIRDRAIADEALLRARLRTCIRIRDKRAAARRRDRVRPIIRLCQRTGRRRHDLARRDRARRRRICIRNAVREL